MSSAQSGNMIGAYGSWAASLIPDGPARLSFRNRQFTNLNHWKKAARRRYLECLAMPPRLPTPKVRRLRTLNYDGLHIEELTWRHPNGPSTRALFLKPLGAKGKLPGILGFHDHAANKYFGHEKITQTTDRLHRLMAHHRKRAYGGISWANALAKRGYAVLVHDAFAFASRRVLLDDVSPEIRWDAREGRRGDPRSIHAYNQWAMRHEEVMAQSLFCAGTTWPGVFVSEDRSALDILCARPDVDPRKIGCGGLSGGGLRTVYLSGFDDRIKCAVCVGMMTTWRDYLLNKCHTHTWMVYIPHLSRDLDYPEILGLRVPLPTLVLNDTEDPLFSLPEMRKADRILREVYRKAGASDRYECRFYPGPHKFDQPMQADAFQFFDRWLK